MIGDGSGVPPAGMLGQPSSSVLDGGQPGEGRVRPVGVVLDPPGFDNDLGLEQGGELLDVEQLVADAAVEGLDEGVLPWRAGLDEFVVVPAIRHQSRSAQAMISGPLSMRRCSGAPRWPTRSLMTATT